MLDSLRPFVIPALSAKGQKLAFVTRGPFSCRRRRRRHGRGAGRHKSGEPCMRAGSNAQAWAGRGTGTQIIRTGTVFQCAPAAADPAAAARGELTEVGAERSVQRWAEIFRQATCAALPSSRPGRNSVGWRSALCAAVSGIQQAQLTKPDGKFAIFRQAMCAARSCISIQQARHTMHGGKFLPAGFADAGDLALIRQLTEADTADAVFS